MNNIAVDTIYPLVPLSESCLWSEEWSKNREDIRRQQQEDYTKLIEVRRGRF
jgi:hypothetical protein